MKKYFQSIGVISRLKQDDTAKTLQELIEFLQQRQLEVLLADSTAKLIANDLATVADDVLAKHCDLIVSIGGDGNLLNAARLAATYDTPVIGVNRGRFGFLTDIRPNKIPEMMGDILDGKFIERSRFMLDMAVCDKHTKIDGGLALNDVVLAPNQTNHMIEFEIRVNNKFMCSQKSDGLIISTPTGSTAYALSGGGSILHPKVNAVIMLPIFPHTLSNRPVVIDADSEIMITIPETAKYLPRASCDSQTHTPIKPGNTVRIVKADKPVRLIHPLSYDYYANLRGKLNWGQRLTNGD
ncbi:MAG: NAD(+) kinase [Pseudomonadota bacterium]